MCERKVITDEGIKKMYEEGYSTGEIAKYFGEGVPSVSGKLTRMRRAGKIITRTPSESARLRSLQGRPIVGDRNPRPKMRGRAPWNKGKKGSQVPWNKGTGDPEKKKARLQRYAHSEKGIKRRQELRDEQEFNGLRDQTLREANYQYNLLRCVPQ